MTHHDIAMAKMDVARKYLEWRISALEAPLTALQQQGDEDRAQSLLDQSWILKNRIQSVEDVVTVLKVMQELGVYDD